MINVRKDLIAEELKNNHGFQFSYQKLSNRFLDWLFNHYNVGEYTIHFYDSEPEPPEDYDFNDAEFDKKWKQMVQDYEPERMIKCNWIDVFGPGIWHMTQRETNKLSKEVLKEIRGRISIKDRLYYANTGDDALIYFYGRDMFRHDLWFVFRRKK